MRVTSREILAPFATILVAACATPTAAPPPEVAPSPAIVAAPRAPMPALDAPLSNTAPAREAVLASASAPSDPTCDATSRCQGESCCTRIEVPAGTYRDDRVGEVPVSRFSLDKYELTVGRVRRWVEAGSPVPREGEVIGRTSEGAPVVWGAGFRAMTSSSLQGWARYDTWTAKDPSLPKNFIDWYTAAAVCRFAGGRLPTDAEWRYVATGGDESREFPWGSAPQTPERAVYNCMGDGNQSCSLADILPVGSRPQGAGRWGHLDLAGSMFEWTADAGGGGDVSVARGGGFCYIGGIDRRTRRRDTAENVRHDPPSSTSHMVGARCAFDVEEAGGATLAAR